jgi:hypothetical protein
MSGLGCVALRSMSIRQRLFAIAAALLCFAAPLSSDAKQHPGLLSNDQLKALSVVRIEVVVPSYVPPGFTPQVKVAQAERYVILYTSKSGAHFEFDGASADQINVAQSTPKPQHHNIFSSIGSLFKKPKTQPTTQAMQGETEANPNQGLDADSHVIGEAHFTYAQNCSTGQSDKAVSNGKYTSKYILTACQTSDDDIVRIYRSATKISPR